MERFNFFDKRISLEQILRLKEKKNSNNNFRVSIKVTVGFINNKILSERTSSLSFLNFILVFLPQNLKSLQLVWSLFALKSNHRAYLAKIWYLNVNGVADFVNLQKIVQVDIATCTNSRESRSFLESIVFRVFDILPKRVLLKFNLIRFVQPKFEVF